MTALRIVKAIMFVRYRYLKQANELIKFYVDFRTHVGMSKRQNKRELAKEKKKRNQEMIRNLPACWKCMAKRKVGDKIGEWSESSENQRKLNNCLAVGRSDGSLLKMPVIRRRAERI